ncbi:prolipoprotein diacylglyceryl transferase [Candidatus Palauibacter polyketidifaciens]|uniref:prolipoprotein diacylglyceryl transferase n=1 Tax=Candidatus Palauibacter polyketidifaciens TaxID=3056740 RepID=UPI00139E143B|nr:prolipoprotein diacylglyceryl transferase [Candidatus Palauibacter polyketidifaciens]MDE2719802.1 prolipoprotein diacylglyceryl transferase [Candidatus Palauibacter polyketidifaciens]MYE33472.1 prolipoprotein diacylglyceryl transferase [Gemmatimonadales bacterium]
MYPELFTLTLPVLGEVTITSFGVMMALAFLSGYMVLRQETVRLGAGRDLAADMLLGALIGGIVGAKIYYVLLYWDRTALDPLGMIFSRSGLVWYGGFIGGCIGVMWILYRRPVSTGLGVDAIAPALPLAYGIGRIGCFLVGDDYGRPTESWVGIAFPNGLPPTTAGNLRGFGADVDPSIPDSQVLAVHPTQLYETGLSLIIFFLVWRLRRHPHVQGWLFGMWLAMAAVERFVIEVFRAKDDRFFGGFTLAQVISVLMFAGGIALVLRLRRRTAEAAV